MRASKYIGKSWGDSFIVWRDELEHVFKDIGVVIFFLVVPLAYPVIYGLIYNPETIHEVPMVVVDESDTSLSREFVRRIDTSPDAKVYKYASNMEEAKSLVDGKKAYGVLLIPRDFSLNIHRGEQARVALYCDMSGLLFYKALLLSTTEASFGMREVISMDAVDVPVPYESVAMYNPQNGFASFLVPGILALVIQQTLLLGICMLAATNREHNPGGRLIPPREAYHGTFRIVFGKSLAYLSVYIFVSVWALVIVPTIFGLPQIVRYGTLLLFTLPYLLACIFFAMTVSTFIRGRETPMMVLVFTSLPLLFLSGISWPLSAIPDGWLYFGHLFPSTFGIQGFIKLNTMGATLRDVAFEYRGLWIQAGVYFMATYLIYRNAVNKKLKDKS